MFASLNTLIEKKEKRESVTTTVTKTKRLKSRYLLYTQKLYSSTTIGIATR